MPPSRRMMRALRRCHGRPVRLGTAVPRHGVTPSAYRVLMSEREEQPLAAPPPAPPPMRQGGVPRPPVVLPPNEFGQLVKRGFGLGVGIWLAFAALSAAAWFVLVMLITVALSG